ncbi:MAG: DUF1955 domain-containing protein [Sulfolobales archaeon]|nr:DUF1955 domain-containing protein [Sulfolobales archaeon]
MSLSLDQYKSLLHVKESLFLKKREEAFEELRRVLREIPSDADVNWFGCNVIDVADCETLVQFYLEFGNRFYLRNCMNLNKLATCLAGKVDVKVLAPIVKTVIAQGRGNKIIEAASSSNYETVKALVDALELIGERDLARSVLNSACRGGVKEACEKALPVAYT